MYLTHRSLTVVLSLCTVLATACGSTAGTATSNARAEEPARVEPIAGTELSRVILTEEAAHRLDLQTEEARTEEVEGELHLVISYAALIYDVEGEAWAYTNPEPLTFVRHSLEIEDIEGDLVVLAEGPPAGTAVVTVGAAELYGAEFEFQEG